MRIISNSRDYYSEILRLSNTKTNYFYIATYNLKYDDNFINILNRLHKNCKDVKIIIGLNDPSIKQIRFLKDKLSRFNVKIFNNSHLKMIVSDNASIIGGRNLTNSDWKDVSVKFINKKNILELKREFLKNYNSKVGLL